MSLERLSRAFRRLAVMLAVAAALPLALYAQSEDETVDTDEAEAITEESAESADDRAVEELLAEIEAGEQDEDPTESGSYEDDKDFVPSKEVSADQPLTYPVDI